MLVHAQFEKEDIVFALLFFQCGWQMVDIILEESETAFIMFSWLPSLLFSPFPQ